MQVAFFLCAKTSIRGEPFNWKLVLFKQHFFYNNLFQALCQRGRLKKWWAGDERGLVEKEGATFPFHSRIPLATDPACCPLAFSIVLADREPTKFHVFAGNTDVMLNPKDLGTSLCAVFQNGRRTEDRIYRRGKHGEGDSQRFYNLGNGQGSEHYCKCYHYKNPSCLEGEIISYFR